MEVPCVTVRHIGDRWGVTQKGLDWFLAEFSLWQDAIDYARGLAVASERAIVEGEDFQGRVLLRQVFSTDASGVVHVQSMTLPETAERSRPGLPPRHLGSIAASETHNSAGRHSNRDDAGANSSSRFDL
jgi:hypothetical protein